MVCGKRRIKPRKAKKKPQERHQSGLATTQPQGMKKEQQQRGGEGKDWRPIVQRGEERSTVARGIEAARTGTRRT